MFYVIVCVLVWHKSLKSIGQLFARERYCLLIKLNNFFSFHLVLPRTALHSSELWSLKNKIAPNPCLNHRSKVSPKCAHLTVCWTRHPSCLLKHFARLLCHQHYLSFNNDVCFSAVVPDRELVYICSPWVSWFSSSSSESRFCCPA